MWSEANGIPAPMGSSSRRSEYRSVFVSEIVFFVYFFLPPLPPSSPFPFRSDPFRFQITIAVFPFQYPMSVRFRFPATEPNRIESQRPTLRFVRSLEPAEWAGPGRTGTHLAQQHLPHHKSAAGTAHIRLQRCYAACRLLRFDTFRGAEVLQQRDPILSTKVHELDVLHPIVEEDALAVGIHAAVGAVQVLGQGPWDVVGSGPLATGLHHPTGQLQESGRLQGHVLDEADHQRIVAET